ncbi:hypothetical protein J4225_05040 [Candidatus Pacearchaeota archaeon]|nr:hypothetical protein [Candidatus Pacearchaeota archaeon]
MINPYLLNKAIRRVSVKGSETPIFNFEEGRIRSKEKKILHEIGENEPPHFCFKRVNLNGNGSRPQIRVCDQYNGDVHGLYNEFMEGVPSHPRHIEYTQSIINAFADTIAPKPNKGIMKCLDQYAISPDSKTTSLYDAIDNKKWNNFVKDTMQLKKVYNIISQDTFFNIHDVKFLAEHCTTGSKLSMGLAKLVMSKPGTNAERYEIEMLNLTSKLFYVAFHQDRKTFKLLDELPENKGVKIPYEKEVVYEKKEFFYELISKIRNSKIGKYFSRKSTLSNETFKELEGWHPANGSKKN